MFRFIKRKYRRFKSWMRYDPPCSLSTKGWRLFDEEFKKTCPIRYYFNHGFKQSFIYPIKWKHDAICDWITYRTICRNHILDTGLKPGYYENDEKMLHVNFNILKDYVEIELASLSFWKDEYRATMSFLEKYSSVYRAFLTPRRPEFGIKHLEWASTLGDPKLPAHERSDQQAYNAIEALALYKWWVQDRPARKLIKPLPYSDQGLGGLDCLDDDFDRDAPDYKAYVASMLEASKQEEEWKIEDTEMLIRLIKIRGSLWT